MPERHEIRAYDYVNRPYAMVAQALTKRTTEIFAHATRGANRRAEALASTLRVELGGVEIGRAIEVQIVGSEEQVDAFHGPTTRITLAWRASKTPELFPTMEAVLSIYALSPTETQLDLRGTYSPPLSIVGTALDAIVGHRVAEASVRRFVDDVAKYLSETLPAS